MGIEWDMLYRLLLASFLGGLIGLEREVHGRPAGFRTHLLVSLGSSLFVVTSIEFYRLYGNFSGVVPVGVDPGRVAAQVVTGIGFLGAGAIIREKASIRGLTTAACLWVASAIGVACGVGLFSISVVVTVIALASLLLLKKAESLLQRDTYRGLKVWCEDVEGQMSRIEEVLAACHMDVVNSSVEKDQANGEICYEFHLRFTTRTSLCPIVDNISAIGGVKKVRLD